MHSTLSIHGYHKFSCTPYIAGLAVDWINDKLYWTDRSNHRIEEYDLMTSQRRVVLTTGDSSLPVGLAVYPFQNPG